MTGIEPEPFTVIEFRGESISPLGTRRYVMSGPLGKLEKRVYTSEPVVHERTYSIDEMPPEFRKEVEKMLARGESTAEFSEVRTAWSPPGGPPLTKISYRDAAGNVHHFQSIDEMPPEIRTILEQMKKGRIE